MNVEQGMPQTKMVDRYLLETMVKGSEPTGKAWSHPLVKRHYSYSDQYGYGTWSGLDGITPEGLYEIYQVIREARKCLSGKQSMIP